MGNEPTEAELAQAEARRKKAKHNAG